MICQCGHDASEHALPGQARSLLPCEHPDCDCQDLTRGNVKVACVSDLHGHLPDLPDCDLLLIGGDIVPLDIRPRDYLGQAIWINRAFNQWVKKWGKPTFVVAGNHDFVFEQDRHLVVPEGWTYLEDELAEFNGLKIWGSPWQPRFHDWAFNLCEANLAKRWDLISPVDILLLHGPPRGFGDQCSRDERVGSPSLLSKIREIQPRLVVFGHIHEGFGSYRDGKVSLVNASLVNERYEPVNSVRIMEID